MPVPDIAHHGSPEEDELNCLVMNITVPKVADPGNQVPVMVYIHGGSFLYGGGNKAVFDGVNFVTFAQQRQTPVVAVNFNYRVGLGGFLASHAIKADLARDGFKGVGNFGLYDQQVALAWVQRYISAFGGDPDEVTIYGESAGGMSVSHQVAAKHPAPFKRAIAMSGHLNTIPTWSLDRHDKHYQALLTYLNIDPDATDSLDRLRRIPEKIVAAATLHIEGVFVATGNPCDDGNFHITPPKLSELASPPPWLEGYMVGDVLDEGMIFSGSFADETFGSVRARLTSHLGPDMASEILQRYNITPQLSSTELNAALQVMAGDTTFRAHNWLAVHRSNVPQTFAYHFDRVSTYGNALKGLAYHALDLLYLFLNFDEHFTAEQRGLARLMAGHWIDFAYGLDPWPRFSANSQWMRYGPDDGCTILTEAQDEPVRRYDRTRDIMAMGSYDRFVEAVDDIAVKRFRMGKFLWNPPV